jgi:sulfatase maturation enzyme AslB (radical SAM superfamily)
MLFYVVPSWKCNLNCSHCTVKNRPYKEDSEKLLHTIIEQSKLYPNAEFALHGGEPTINKNLFVKILETGVITGITTNLIVNDQEIIDLINEYDIGTSTSWNVKRFSNEQLFNLWKENIKKLKRKPLVLITLDKDLVKMNQSEVINIIESFENVDEILFECLLDNNLNDKFQDTVDKWLCELDKQWISKKVSKVNLIRSQILNWNFNCNTKTILPNGEIRDKCILATDNKQYFLKKCLNCKYNKICIPCRLHSRCSFFPKFYERILNEK